MWLKIEAFDESSVTSGEPVAVLHSCLATTPGAEGLIASVGRKAGEITFPSDKSVSRQHCQLKFLYEPSTENNKAPKKNSHATDYAAPRTDKERDACHTNPFGLCVVLENAGKGGTYFVEPLPLPKNNNDKETTPESDATDDGGNDSETDDEGVSQIKGKATTSQRSQLSKSSTPLVDGRFGDGRVETGVTFSSCTQRLLGDRSAQLVKLEVGESRILDFEGAGRLFQAQPHEERSILIQCGLNEATLRITWVPFYLALSRMPKGRASLSKELYRIGALEESIVSHATTHLITPEVVGTAKPLTAWCRSLPLLTPEYLDALLERSSCTDPLPDPKDFQAPPKTKNMEFLEEQANPKLMAAYKVLTVDSSEVEALMEFSGATVVPLYEEAAETAIAKAEEIVHQCEKEAKACLVLWSRKKLCTQVSKLDGVSVVKQNTWAKAISQQDATLTDSKGNFIEMPIQPTPPPPPPPPTKSKTQQEAKVPPPPPPPKRKTKAPPPPPPPRPESAKTQVPLPPPPPPQKKGPRKVPPPPPPPPPPPVQASTSSSASPPSVPTVPSSEKELSLPKTQPGLREQETSIRQTTTQSTFQPSDSMLQLSSSDSEPEEMAPLSTKKATRRKRDSDEHWSPMIKVTPPSTKRRRREETEVVEVEDLEDTNTARQSFGRTQSQKKARSQSPKPSAQDPDVDDGSPDVAIEGDAEHAETLNSKEVPMEEDSPNFQTGNEDEEADAIDEEMPAPSDQSVEAAEPAGNTLPSNPVRQSIGVLPPIRDGWFTVAPKEDAKRKAIRRKAFKKQLEEDPDAPETTSFRPPATSETVALVITPEPEATTNASSSSSQTQSGSDRFGRRRPRTGPNFKGFRKNLVPRTIDECEFIPMRSVLPKESEQQRRLDDAQREVEAEQRRADELFRDIGGSGMARGGPRRRRR